MGRGRRARRRLPLGLMICALGAITVAVGLGALSYSRERYRASLDLVRMSERVQRELASVHLWFEEWSSNDAFVDLEADVVVPLTRLTEDYDRFVAQVRSDPGASGPVRIERVAQDLRRFKEVLEARTASTGASGIGTSADQELDAIFERILAESAALARESDARVASDRSAIGMVNRVAIVAVGLLFAIVAALVSRHRRDLERRNIELEDRVRERTASLQDLNEELQDVNEELVAQRDRAQSASRAKSQFLANLSHEIRTPLHGILGTVSLLERDAAEAAGPPLERIRRAGGALLDLLTSILDHARAESGRLELREIDFEAGELVGDTLDLFRPEAEARGLSIEIEEDLPVTRLRGDRGRLRQVLVNLVSNAIKFTRVGGVTVRVRTSIDASSIAAPVALTIEVEDTGGGIAPADRERVFAPFTQLDGSSAREEQGAGLGLTISRQLVELMGGVLALDSEPGCGATFGFTVRLARGTPESAEEASPTLEGRGRTSKAGPIRRALVVDDNAVNRELLTQMLDRLGIEARAADSGDSAEVALADEDFDLVLLDLQMPRRDGFEVLADWKARGAVEAPIVALSARDLADDPRRLDFAEVWTKPLTLDSLRRGLRGLEYRREGAAAPHSAKTSRSEFDFDRFRELLAVGDEEFRRGLLEIFLAETAETVVEVEEAARGGDHRRVRFLTHRLASGADHLGAKAFARVCREIEEVPESLDPAYLVDRWRATREVLVRLRDEEER